jgi:hypothetical protein
MSSAPYLNLFYKRVVLQPGGIFGLVQLQASCTTVCGKKIGKPALLRNGTITLCEALRLQCFYENFFVFHDFSFFCLTSLYTLTVTEA